MNIYITIDGGTTNTRVMLLLNGALRDTVRLGIGARAGIDGNTELKRELRSAIHTLLSRHRLDESDVECILASGMITSEFGLCHLDHIAAPAGLSELHDSMERVTLPDIASIPFFFIRGVRMHSDSYEQLDVMRGEETELMGILQDQYGECVYVLPGSHSKIIRVDAMGRIVDFTTMMTGEMIGALSQHTILKDAVDLATAELNREYLLRGYDYALEAGINKALFKTRVLKNFVGRDKDEVYSFFLGAVLSAEIAAIVNTETPTVVLGGRAQIRNAMAHILRARDNKRVVCLDDATVHASVAMGAIRVFEYTSV